MYGACDLTLSISTLNLSQVNLGNYKNIVLAFSRRYQMSQCYHFAGKLALRTDMSIKSFGKQILLSSLHQQARSFSCYTTDIVWSVNEAVVDTCTFAVRATIIIDIIYDGDPVFLKIKYLLFPRDSHLDITGKLMLPVQFVIKYYAYEVIDNDWALYHSFDQTDYALLKPHEIGN